MYPVTLGLIIGTQSLFEPVQECLRGLPVRVLFEQAAVEDWPALLQNIDGSKPDLVVVDVGALKEPLGQAFAKIRALSQPPLIAALHTEGSPELILEAVRAGASDFLYPPVDQSLRTALMRISDTRQQQRGSSTRRGGKVLGFLSAKGGCGATTIACHLALELPRQTGSHALLADFDFDAGLVEFLMKTRSEYSVLDAANNLHRLDLSFWKKIISNGIPGLEIITAPSTLGAREIVKPQTAASILAFTRAHYDWTVVDLGRGLTKDGLETLESVDQVYLVSTMEIPALHQAKTHTQRLLDSGFKRENLRLVINRMPRNPELTIDELEVVLGHPVFATVPNDYPSLHDSYAQGRLLREDAPIRRHLATVARRIAGVEDQKPAKKRFSLFG